VADTATEEEIRSRVVAYLADRRAFELRAAARLRDVFDWDNPGEVDDRQQSQLDQLEAEYLAYHGPHLTSQALASTRGLAVAEPASVDPAWTVIESVRVKGSAAIVATQEDEVAGVLPPSRYEYRLQLEGGRWLLADRRLYDNDGITRPRWLRGLL
jgi:hypothetical protein